ncbi:M56 family metallopeptidase [Clostridium saccharoperbutylacetonicum]|uniref:M56 family metallopeptidase n=1 Tax=Clostridium saccharoperbutylacetonicum TaxID=36745 RepID=UPI000983A4BC|nr:M56 family metallopeptidase [Clostridium saccharoperbutylacetonicum]AQR93854.1 regulatory protein BlaR1 [Clostridium saccharoperbutylacetonicum]NSB29554.1 beta-lactamase regulating signal transducer with metallopeptidase domain [Clostridium saccharoperbutylacetonicum]
MDIFKILLQITLTGSLLFLILLLFVPFTKKVFSATWNYYMLVITLVFFIIPIGSFIKFPEIVVYKGTVPIETTSKTLQLDNKKISQGENKDDIRVLNDKNELVPLNTNEITLREAKPINEILKKEILTYIWAIGIIIFIAKEAYNYRSFYKKLNIASNMIEDEIIINALETSKKNLNISKKIIFCECSCIKSPMITGILKPTITIPKREENLDKLEIILTHELLHFKRKDLWIKIMALVVNIINWFNPIAYIIRSKINVECELSLDEHLIRNMDKSKRKYYGEIILEQIEYSQNKSLSLGASVCKGRKELETRLKNIIFFKKSRKLIVGISFIAAMFFTFTSLFTANAVFADNSNLEKNNKTAEFAAFVANDGLYMSELKENNSILLDKSQKIKKPLISKNGLFVAYTKEENLYVCNIKTREIMEVSKNIESYDWNNSGDLIYYSSNSGISMYNAEDKNSKTLISNEYDYYNINCDSKGKIYANKELKYSEGNDKKIKTMGIICYDLNTKEEKVILASKEGTNKEINEKYTISELFESIGSTPNVSKVSTDDKYLYIWNGPKSGSLSADATEFSVYDILNNKFIENNNMIALAYKDNISQNPVDSNLVAVNNGEYRDMYYNKTLGIYNVDNNSFTNLLPQDQVSMTPDYSADGKNIVYSGTNSIKDSKLISNKEWENQAHHIYAVNTDTKKVIQITNSKAFDFMPKYLLNNEILFVREDGNSYSLWKTKDGVETKLADNLNFKSNSYTNTWYYGHYETEQVVDLFLG